MTQQVWKQKDIALAIRKDKSVVSRELNRNCNNRDREYRADLAQRKYENRQKNKPKHIRFTEEVKQYVEECLAKDFSPEQTAERANADGRIYVIPESIYMCGKIKKKEVIFILICDTKDVKYQKRRNAKDTRGIIKDRVDIGQRPEIVAKKERWGKLKIDTLIVQNHKGVLLTINERVSSIVIIEN